MEKRKTYKVIRDFPHNGKFRGAGMVYKFSDKDAEKYLAKNWIIPFDVKPKRYVILDGVKMTWGEYLKRKYANRKIP